MHGGTKFHHYFKLGVIKIPTLMFKFPTNHEAITSSDIWVESLAAYQIAVEQALKFHDLAIVIPLGDTETDCGNFIERRALLIDEDFERPMLLEARLTKASHWYDNVKALESAEPNSKDALMHRANYVELQNKYSLHTGKLVIGLMKKYLGEVK